jgi:RNA polymerase sigma-70 factor (ECF subfamily)
MKTAPSRFREAIAALTPQLRGFARFLARDAARADDLVQEALLRALENEAGWQAGTDLRAWMFRILRNAFFDQVRRQGSERRILRSLPPRQAQAPAQGDTAELDELGRAIASLPAAEREVMLLVAGLGFTVAEAAAVIGVPEGTLKARMARARAALARRFGARA